MRQAGVDLRNIRLCPLPASTAVKKARQSLCHAICVLTQLLAKPDIPDRMHARNTEKSEKDG